MFLHKAVPIFYIRGWAFIRGSIFWEIACKISIFGVQTGEWASIRAQASNSHYRDFMVYPRRVIKN